MKLLDALPAAPLAPFVERFWHVETDPQETPQRPDAILPNGAVNLIFNLGGHPHREYTSEACQDFQELKSRWLSGLRDSPLVVGPTVGTKVVGVRFQPGGLVPFLRARSNELVRMTVDPDGLWGDETDKLHDRLLNTPQVDACFQLLEEWLTRRFDLPMRQEGLIRSLATLQSHSGNIPIERLARTADLSLRQYRRRFEDAVGLPPKRLARVLRFTKVIRSIRPEQMCVLQLGIGAAVQWQHWDKLPLWYHLTFFVLLVAGILLGGWIHVLTGDAG